jgi:hypothetical protein
VLQFAVFLFQLSELALLFSIKARMLHFPGVNGKWPMPSSRLLQDTEWPLPASLIAFTTWHSVDLVFFLFIVPDYLF